jgi:hypothetical protein
VLQNWDKETGKAITNVLTIVNDTKQFKGKQVEEILKAVTEFHRDITKADEALIDVKWFELCIGSKRKLKKLQENLDKQKKKEPALEKKASTVNVIYPEIFSDGRGANEERILKFFFKSFVTNFEESMTDPRLTPFIIATYKELKYKFGGTSSITRPLRRRPEQASDLNLQPPGPRRQSGVEVEDAARSNHTPRAV